uniref:Uncharacterized protein n=1 Tax=Hordeum vulgare subsp. vulgare TaxID=112509 RepID=A0A8I6XIJ5_HORVV
MPCRLENLSVRSKPVHSHDTRFRCRGRCGAVRRVPPASFRRRRRHHHQGAGEGQGRAQAARRRRRAQPPPRLLAHRRRHRGRPGRHGGYNYRGTSTSAVLAHLADGNNWHAEDKEDDDADLVAAALRGISDLYDLIVSLQAAPGGQEDDADGTADTDEIEEQDAEITDDVDEDEEEEDDGLCVVRGITIALEFSDGEEDWIVV